MKLCDLNFELRNDFPEMRALFCMMNDMIRNGNKAKLSLEVDTDKDGYRTDYLCISINPCDNYLPSIGMMRTIVPPSLETISMVLDMLGQNTFLYFEADACGSKAIVSVFDNKEEGCSNDAKLTVLPNKNLQDFLTLDFFTLKPFPELPRIFSIANSMFSQSASCNVSIKPTVNRKNQYLNVNVMFENISRPSLYVNIEIAPNSIGTDLLLKMTKLNYICSTLMSFSIPIYLSHSVPVNGKDGLLIQIHLADSIDPCFTKNIKKQCALLEAIFPQK